MLPLFLNLYGGGYDRCKPDFCYGTPSSLIAIAKYASDNSKQLHQPKVIASIGQLISDQQYQYLRSSFKDSVIFDLYGCTEAGNFAVSRSDDIRKHLVWSDTCIVNVDGDTAPDSENHTASGSLLLTSLIHRGFPIVNYRIGDEGDVTYENGAVYVKTFKGRSDDVIKNADGSVFNWSMISRCLYGVYDVIQFRVTQESLSELKFELVAVPSLDQSGKDSVEKTIMERADEFLENRRQDIHKNISIEWVDYIDPDPSGKLRMLIRKC